LVLTISALIASSRLQASHPEKWLVAYVSSELTSWLKRIVPEESDKYVMLAAWNLVNCIAFAELAGK
jgi:hypothetical protein